MTRRPRAARTRRLIATFMDRTLRAATLGFLIAAHPPARAVVPPDVPTLLASYHHGAHDDTRRALARLSRDDLPAFRRALTMEPGQTWLAQGDDPGARLITAAAVALELEAIAVERGQWSTVAVDSAICAGRCVLGWARTLLATRPAPDLFERDWLLAALAVVGAARDWPTVYSPLSPIRSTRTPAPVEGIAAYGVVRFPTEARFKLARAMAIAARYGVMTEMDGPQPGVRTGATAAFAPEISAIAFLSARATANIEFASHQFTELVSDPDVGAEARVRRAYLHLRLANYEATLVDARTAAAAANDADVRYVAWFLAGLAAQTLGDVDAADAHFAAALEARPHSQSAVIARAALRFQRGDATTAASLVESAFETRAGDNDPWRLFLYGDYRLLDERLRSMRARLLR